MPILSIVIPVYNTAEYLDRCVQSLINQAAGNIEIILVDDGSSDASPQMCDSYASKYDYIRVIHKKNGGLASARNAGIEAAKGKYINFLDSDDWLSDGAIEDFISIILGFHPDAIGFGCQRTTGKRIYSKKVQPWFKDFHNEMDEIKADFISDNKLFRFGIIRSSCMHIFKKQIIDDLGLRFVSERTVLNEDYLFVTHFMLQAENYFCCKETYYNYFFRLNSLTTTYLTDMFERKTNLMKAYDEFLSEYPSEEFVYRMKLFYLDNCYECLANEAGAGKKAEVQRILDDICEKDVLKGVRMEEQSKKARLFLKLMKHNNASEYIAAYKLFKIAKEIKWKLKGR